MAARSPDDSAYTIVQLVARGKDPFAAARAFATGAGARFGLRPRSAEVGQLAAARAVGSDGDATLDATWLALRNYTILTILGLALVLLGLGLVLLEMRRGAAPAAPAIDNGPAEA